MSVQSEKIRKEKEKMIEERRKAIEAQENQLDDETPPGDLPPDNVPPADEPPVVTPDPVEDETFKQKYLTLEGKYRAEVPRLHQQLREVNERLQTVTAQMEEMQRVKPTTTAQELEEDGKTPVYRSALVTDAMRNTPAYQWRANEYGISEAEYSAEMSISAAQSTVKPVQDQIGDIQAETLEEKFDRLLHEACPAWTGKDSGINVDEDFGDWLNAEDQVDAANVAYQNADVQKLARIIQRYQKTITKSPVPIVPESLVAPKRSGGGKQTQIDNAKGDVLKYSDMQELYASHARGEWRGKEEKYRKKKAEFMKAKEEGRLI